MPSSKALLLGMYYSMEDEPKRGQGFRDRVRCEAMESLGYETFTLDDKHSEEIAVAGHHCQTNFSDHRRMLKSISDAWSEQLGRGFDLIILDYFFSPEGWTEFRWTENFFSNSLPLLAERNIISEGGYIWLPHVGHVQKMMEKCHKELDKFFEWEAVPDPKKNPLFLATDNVYFQLKRCPDNMTNDTQLRPLMASGTPFFVLRCRKSSEILNSKLMKKNSENSAPQNHSLGVPGKTTRSGREFSVPNVASSSPKKRKRNIWLDSPRKRRQKPSSSPSSSKKAPIRTAQSPMPSARSPRPPGSPSSNASVRTPQTTGARSPFQDRSKVTQMLPKKTTAKKIVVKVQTSKKPTFPDPIKRGRGRPAKVLDPVVDL